MCYEILLVHVSLRLWKANQDHQIGLERMSWYSRAIRKEMKVTGTTDVNAWSLHGL
jgi:hypothetical protein